MAQSVKPIIERLESLFAQFNDRFYENELQTPVITVSPDTQGAFGWCTGWKAWTEDKPNPVEDVAGQSENIEKEGYYEINICAEYLARPFEEIAETLLHEMVHLYNLQIGVKDTSRHGTYHNKHYKDTAENRGLKVEKNSRYGWSRTSLNDEAVAYVDGLQDKKFELYRRSVSHVSKSKSSSRKYVCPKCGAIVRATKAVNVICGDCAVLFEEQK